MAVFYNYATLSYNQGVTNSNVVTGELVEVITVTKNAVANGYRAGDTVTYVVNIINSGNTAYNNLTLTDDLGAYTVGENTYVPLTYLGDSVQYYVNGVLQASPVVISEKPFTVSGINVPADSNVAIVYRATVNEFAPLTPDSVLTNTASVSGGGLSAAVSDTETLSVFNEAYLGITKSINPTTVVENEPLNYTFVITNMGNAPAVATDNVILTDNFNPALNITAVTFNGSAWSSPANYTYDEATGMFSTVAGQITVPAATYSTDPMTGAVAVTPGTAVLTVTGTI